MNPNAPDDDGVEDRLRRHRLVPPTPELRARILGTAREAWRTAAPDDIPWIWPILRLAASLALALLPVVLALSLDAHRVNPSSAMLREPSPAARETAALWTMNGRPDLARLCLLADSLQRRDAAKTLPQHWRKMADPFRDGQPDGG